MSLVLDYTPRRHRRKLSIADTAGSETNRTRWMATLHEIFSRYDSTVCLEKLVEATTIIDGIVTGEPVDVSPGVATADMIATPTPTAVVTQLWTASYYHLIAEALPRIIRLNKLYPEMSMLVAMAPFTPGVLEFFKITNPVIPYQAASKYFIKAGLYITETLCGNPTKTDLELIRSRVSEILGATAATTTTAVKIGIIIFRKEPSRRIINFAELVGWLYIKFPTIKWVIFDSLSFGDTVKLFSEAAVVIGAHGAGLVNTIFCKDRVTIVELFPVTLANPCYWHLSELLGNLHYIVPGECWSSDLSFMADIDTICHLVSGVVT